VNRESIQPLQREERGSAADALHLRETMRLCLALTVLERCNFRCVRIHLPENFQAQSQVH